MKNFELWVSENPNKSDRYIVCAIYGGTLYIHFCPQYRRKPTLNEAVSLWLSQRIKFRHITKQREKQIFGFSA